MLFKVALFLSILFTGHLFANDKQTIMLATTTSTDNSGLLDYLLPVFEKQHNIHIKVVATGTGRALKLARQGDVDVVIVHAPEKERQFVSNGFGVERKSLMYNHFLIVGPKNDPANIKYADSTLEAFNKIKHKQSIFISRADNSGTYFKELNIWQEKPSGSWYKEVGQGMGKTLQIANELSAYTLVDQATWLKLKNKLQLTELYSGNQTLFNPYSVILVNPKKYTDTHYQQAKIFASWINSNNTKNMISNYKINGQQLFFVQ